MTITDQDGDSSTGDLVIDIIDDAAANIGAELVTAGAPTDAEVRAAGARSTRASSPEGTGGRSPGVPESGDGAGQSAGEAHRPGHGPADGPRR